RGVRHAVDADVQAVRRRARGRDPDRRNYRPRSAPARIDETARGLELVPAQLAPVAAPAPVFRDRGPAPGRAGSRPGGGPVVTLGPLRGPLERPRKASSPSPFH